MKKFKSHLLCCLLFITLSRSAIAQTSIENKFFSDINSIDVIINVEGDYAFCRVSQSDITSAVAYTLSNTPLKKIEKLSPDALFMSFTAMNVTSKSNNSLGCAVATNAELWRRTNFKGSNNLVTVWSVNYLTVGIPGDIGVNVPHLAEKIMKEFISRWSQQR